MEDKGPDFWIEAAIAWLFVIISVVIVSYFLITLCR